MFKTLKMLRKVKGMLKNSFKKFENFDRSLEHFLTQSNFKN